MARRKEIDDEILHLRRLESGLTDQKSLEALRALIAELEAEKKLLPRDEASE